jgi:hypothetical protein
MASAALRDAMVSTAERAYLRSDRSAASDPGALRHVGFVATVAALDMAGGDPSRPSAAPGGAGNGRPHL